MNISSKYVGIFLVKGFKHRDLKRNNNNNNNNNIYFVSQGYTQSFTIFVQVDTGRSEFSELIESDCH